MKLNKDFKNSNPDDYAKQLKHLSGLSINKRHLLNNTLQKINQSNTEQPSTVIDTRNSSIINQFKIYAPLTAVVIVVIISGSLFIRQNNTINNNVSNLSQSAPNGSVKNAINAISADLDTESNMNDQITTDTLTASQQVSDEISKLGDISNDTSL